MSYGTRLEKEVIVKDKDGDDQKFVLIQFDALTGIGHKKKLLKLLVPSFIASQQATQETVVVDVLEKFMENIDDVDPLFLKDLIRSGAYKEGRVTINFENDFAGNYMMLYTLIQEIVMFNYIDVFQRLGSVQ